MKNSKKWKVIILFVVAGLLSISTSHAMVQMGIEHTNVHGFRAPPLYPLDEPIYEWIDDFTSEQLIESTMSYDYEIDDGKARVKSTFPVWTDPNWNCMKPLTVKNNVGKILENYAMKLVVTYDSDMASDYHDLRFRHEDYPTQYLPYWIETYNANQAIVWVYLPFLPTGTTTMYMFYGNDDATSQSNFYEVFHNWDEEWPNDEKLSYHTYLEGAWDPDVAFGDNKFLVVWEEGTAPRAPYTFFYQQDIRGTLYSVDGNPIQQDFTIRSGQGQQWHHEDPSAAYGGGKFFVVWVHWGTSDDETTMDIIGRFVSSNGVVSSSDIKICEEVEAQADPMVKYDPINNRFCVIWEDIRGGNWDIYGKLYDTNGNQIGEEKQICVAANNQGLPWVAFDNLHQQYMIVYEEKTGEWEKDIYGQLFTKDLIPIGNRFLIADGSSSVRYLYPCVEFSDEAERYLVTYNSGTPDKEFRGSIYGKVFDTSGNLKATQLIKGGSSFVRTDIAPYLETAFLVCFNGGQKIWGRFVLVDGEVTVYDEDIQLSASTSAEADWVNVASNTKEIFVTWEDARINYAPPFNGMPDAYCNIWHLNIGESQDVTCTFGNEQNIILSAQITSKRIAPENIFKWFDFSAVYERTVIFDILDESGASIPGYQDISSGKDLSGLNNDVIRLRATLTRTNPSYSPTLDQWMVRYIGEDDEPPVTTIDHIDGARGLNDWYIDESVIIWLHAADFPEQTGSGIDSTYYTINNGQTQEYNPSSGIQLLATQQSDWMGQWMVTFWSVDNANNVENRNKQENTINIKIDAEPPFVEITEPANEQEVTVPFWVRVDATDNAEIDKVEFDIEPFGKRPG
ncbi:MAG: DUF2341 domain-containing protein, partial [Thermoplasmata archaeon]